MPKASEGTTATCSKSKGSDRAKSLVRKKAAKSSATVTDPSMWPESTIDANDKVNVVLLATSGLVQITFDN